MSLVATWALADDNHWYEEPVLGDETNDWFICFDDDDPVELVVRAPKERMDKQQQMAHVQALLDRLQIPGARISGWNHGDGTSRCFPPKDKPHKAIAVWLVLTQPIPARLIRKKDAGPREVLPAGDKCFCNFGRPYRAKDLRGNIRSFDGGGHEITQNVREEPARVCACGRTSAGSGRCWRCGQNMG